MECLILQVNLNGATSEPQNQETEKSSGAEKVLPMNDKKSKVPPPLLPVCAENINIRVLGDSSSPTSLDTVNDSQQPQNTTLADHQLVKNKASSATLNSNVMSGSTSPVSQTVQVIDLTSRCPSGAHASNSTIHSSSQLIGTVSKNDGDQRNDCSPTVLSRNTSSSSLAKSKIF